MKSERWLPRRTRHQRYLYLCSNFLVCAHDHIRILNKSGSKFVFKTARSALTKGYFESIFIVLIVIQHFPRATMTDKYFYWQQLMKIDRRSKKTTHLTDTLILSCRSPLFILIHILVCSMLLYRKCSGAPQIFVCLAGYALINKIYYLLQRRK